ncbi:MAG TPA: N-acetylmuramoyl-L-alanine amidase [bacterium]|nr:N-acetylmuramoyl-L-alanine amidase [bacterium]
MCYGLLLLAGTGTLQAQTTSDAQVLTNFYERNGVNYFSATELANQFRVHTYYNPQVQKLIIYLPDKRLKLSANTSYIMVNDAIHHMPRSVLIANGDLLVPAEDFVRIVQPALDIAMKYDATAPALRFEYSPFNITNIIIEEKKNGTLIRVPVTREFRENEIAAAVKPGWMYLTVAGGYMNARQLARVPTAGAVRRVVPIQMENSAQLSFRLRNQVEDYDVYQNSNPREIVLSLRAPREQTQSRLNEARNRWKLDRIVLDAGHGGKDPGAIGPGGIKEKDVVLDITKRVGRIIEKNLPEVEVIYTREKDVFIPLQERTRIANEKNGKLFVSIHANSNPNRRIRGFETYLLRPGKTSDAIEVAERENSVIKYEESTEIYQRYDDETLILATMMQSAFMKESEDFASMIQSGLAEYVPSQNRGVKQAGFYVLVGASMPNILVEAGYMSNTREVRQLNSPEYRQKVAQGIYEGILEFKKKYDQQTTEQASL